MKYLLVLAFTSLHLLSAPVAEAPTGKIETRIAMAYTDSEAAMISPDRTEAVIYDHYGNPDRFIHYIISIPKIRA